MSSENSDEYENGESIYGTAQSTNNNDSTIKFQVRKTFSD